MSRRDDLEKFYKILHELEDEVEGKRRLENCDGYMNWPNRGVYFFFEVDEWRESGNSLRMTRVGTHAVSEGSSTSLWNRLKMHQGTRSGSHPGGGNHRGSVFRLRVGEAIIEKHNLHDEYPKWGEGSSAGREIRNQEYEMEKRVSRYIRDLPFLWVKVNDEPGPNSQRAYLEKNAIALLSNYRKKPVDPRSEKWLGKYSPKEEIRESGLWNVDHVGKSYDPSFLELLESKISNTHL